MMRQNRPTGRSGLPLSTCATLLLLAVGVAHQLGPPLARPVEAARSISGWTEVNKRWPLDATEYFVATTKGHHYIAVKVPKDLDGDLDVKLEYFYNFQQVRPVIQMVPCASNVHVLEDDTTDPPGKWLAHSRTVKRSDCERRNELAYNVVLHDKEDVFAWRLIKVTKAGGEGQGASSSSSSGPPLVPVPPSSSGSSGSGGDQTQREGQEENRNEIGPQNESPSSSSSGERGSKKASADNNPATKETDRSQSKDTPPSVVVYDAPVQFNTLPDEQVNPQKTIDSLKKPVDKSQMEDSPIKKPPVDHSRRESQITRRGSKVDVPESSSDRSVPPADSIRDSNLKQVSGEKQQQQQPQAKADQRATAEPVNEPSGTNPKQSDPSGSKSVADASGSVPAKGEKGPNKEAPNKEQPQQKTAAEPVKKPSDTTSQKQPPNSSGDKRAQFADTPKPAPAKEEKAPNKEAPNEEQPQQRVRRAAGDQSGPFEVSCRPSACNRDHVQFKHFMTLSRGLPELPAGLLANELGQDEGKRLYMNMNNAPLVLRQESSLLSESNLCVDLRLFMDADTAMDFFIDDASEQSRRRLLETIERKADDSTAGKWDIFKRCMSDYMPKLTPTGSKDKIALAFVPKATAGKRIAMLLNKQESVSLHVPHPAQEYLPNAVNAADEAAVDRYWIMDKDGIKKPQVKLVTEVPEESTSQVVPKRLLQISQIDPSQESFDITSRWIQVNDLETLENPLYFVYKSEPADWIKSIEFGFQNAKRASEGWVTQTVYSAPHQSSDSPPQSPRLPAQPTDPAAQPAQQQTEKEGEAAAAAAAEKGKAPAEADQPPAAPQASETAGAAQGTQPAPAQADAAQSGGLLLPIQLKGLTTDEFRVRVRHHIKDEVRAAAVGATRPQRLELKLATLAFGDVCAGSPFCSNGGRCEPTGPAAAKCHCEPGFTGLHCEVSKPCDKVYGDQLTGHQLCQLAGAHCIEQLPVLRCQWPNDQYYQCRATWQNDTATGEIIPTLPGSSPTQLDAAALDEQNTRQSKIIIIMGVFMLALALFSVVIIGNMVSRLLKSKKRLKRAENEAHELARRSMPGTSAPPVSAPFGRMAARHKMTPSVVNYNNQAFDAE